MHRVIVIALSGLLLVGAALATAADGWSRYRNARFGYAVDVPPGFSDVAEADNSDGGISRSADGDATLSIWGAYLVDRDFPSDIAGRVGSDKDDGWSISYGRSRADSASWSGSKGSRIAYTRAVKGCDDSTAFFRLEYDRSNRKAYDPVVSRLVKSLRAC